MLSKTELLETLDRQVRAHGLDPADERVRGVFNNILAVVLTEQYVADQELKALRGFRERLQLSVGKGTETAVVYEALASLERFYEATT